MTPAAFKHWRKANGFRSQKAAAEALGRSPRQIASYESGEAEIPLTVRLAMAALSLGIRDYPA